MNESFGDRQADTVKMYDQAAEAFSRQFDGNESRLDDVIRAHELGEMTLGITKVVEIGCGDGRDAVHIAANAREYIGYDPSKGMLAIAHNRHISNADFRVGYAQSIDYPKNRDIIFALDSLVHIPGDEMPEVLERIASALVPGGIFYAIIKQADEYTEEIYEDDYELSDGRHILGKRAFYYYSQQEMVDMAGTSGLQLVYAQPSEYPSKPWNKLTLGLQKTTS